MTQLRMLTYSEKLKDPRWQRKRLEILQRDSFTCQAVGCYAKDRTLHVHHRYYVSQRDPWNYPNSAMVTLCDECHEIESAPFPEGMFPRWERAINTIISLVGEQGAISIAEELRKRLQECPTESSEKA